MLCNERALVGARGEFKADATERIDLVRSTMSARNQNSCICRSRKAQYSLASVISTLGLSPRQQKCSSVILLCESCLHDLCDGAVPVSWELREALKNAYYSVLSLRQTVAEKN